MEINIIPKFLDEAITPVAKETGERLADIVSLLFTPIVKAKAKRDKNIELFLKELDKKVSSIPEEKLKDPPLSLVGPAIDNVFKFYHDEKHLRQMYSTLIASSMNSDCQVSPSYIYVIRQLSQNDAVLFSTLLHSLGQEHHFIYYPLFFLELSCDCGIDALKDAELEGLKYFIPYLAEERHAYPIDSSIWLSFESLRRLGLVNIQRKSAPNDILKSYNIEVENIKTNNLCMNIWEIKITHFGIEFSKVCCDTAGTTDCLKNNHYLKKIIMLESGFDTKYEDL